MAKPPVTELAQASLGQEYAQHQPRIIEFANQEAITTTLVAATPVSSTGEPANANMINWLKVEFHYAVNPASPTKYPWVDSAQFKVWIEGRDLYATNPPPGSHEVAVCLTGSVTYLNLQQGADNYGVFYVHPSVLARYCGTGSPDDFDRKFNIHIEAYIGGKLVDYFNRNPKDVDKWWLAPVPISGMVMRQDQTPFLLADVARYPLTQLPASGQ
jgi:hypothetical protein